MRFICTCIEYFKSRAISRDLFSFGKLNTAFSWKHIVPLQVFSEETRFRRGSISELYKEEVFTDFLGIKARMQQALGNDFPIHSRVNVGSKVLRIQQKLGNGAFGVVYKVIDETSSNVYALKDIKCLKDSDIRNAIREVRTMKQISHENVISVKAEARFRDAHGLHMLILTEYCVGGTLNERLTSPSSDEINFKWIHQMAAALAFLHSSRVVHRDLKADNVLLTATEDVKLADFGLAREYIALKRVDTLREDESWISCYIQYYMNSGVGPIHWVAPEFFSHRYNEKADVFSLGTLFFAILERDFIEIDGKPLYGAFKRIPGGGKVGIGYAMANYDPNITIQFSPYAQGSGALQKIALEAMKYNKKDRPCAEEIHNRITKIQGSVRLSSSGNQQASAGWCC